MQPSPQPAGLLQQDPLRETGKYESIQLLGKGSFGFVQLARNLTNGELAAIKMLKRSDVNRYVEAEIENHSLLRHPHVIQFKEVFLTREYICIAMEYATGGSLFHYVQKQGRLKEAVARWFFQQLIIGVDYCHKRGVANRDIKLENTLLQVVRNLPLPLLKICDFGYSKADRQSAAKSKVGTLTYMAPEVLVNKDGKYDGKVADIWSCGVMLYVMLFGRYPFEAAAAGIPKATEIIDMLEKMVNQRYCLPSPCDISTEGRDLLVRMLLPDPAQRITLDQIRQHPWFVTNLPADASNMNASYLRAAFPPGHQSLETIRAILTEARAVQRAGREGLQSSGGGSANGVLARTPSEDAYASLMDADLQEELGREAAAAAMAAGADACAQGVNGTAGKRPLHQFLQQHHH